MWQKQAAKALRILSKIGILQLVCFNIASNTVTRVLEQRRNKNIQAEITAAGLLFSAVLSSMSFHSCKTDYNVFQLVLSPSSLLTQVSNTTNLKEEGKNDGSVVA